MTVCEMTCKSQVQTCSVSCFMASSPFPLFPPVKSLFPSVAPVFPSFVFYVFFCGQSRFPMYLRGCLICSIRVLSVFHPWLTISASPYWFQASLGEHLPPSFV